MAKNQFKSEKSEDPIVKKDTSKKKRKLFSKTTESANSVNKFIKDERTKNIVGLLFILLSAFLLVAFTSFIFTWEADQSKLELSIGDFLWNPEVKAENWLGKFGAAISHLFVYKWFGIASFAFVVLSFIVGFKILFKISLLPIKRTFRISFFTLIFLSLLLSFFFTNSLYYLGGGFGYQMNAWLQSVLGYVGTGFLISFAFLAFLTISFNLKFAGLIKQSTEKEEEIADEEDLNPIGNQINQPTAEDELEIEDQYNEEEIMPTLKAEEKVDEIEEPTEEKAEEAIELAPQVEETPKEEDNDGFSFEVAHEEKTIDEATKETEEAEKELDLEIEAPVEEEELDDDDMDSRVREFGEYDPTLDLPNYSYPTIDLLKDYGSTAIRVDKEELEANKNRIVKTLENYNIKIDSIKATVGPTVTLYEIVPAPGVRISKIKNLEDDIALSLAALGIRIIAPIPGKGTIGIEVPNQNPDIVSMRSVIASEKFQNSKMELPVVMGKTISNETFVFDLAKMPHLLMAGATGQGKSVGLNAVLASLLYMKHPAQLKFVLVDPKKVELTLFNKVERHFLAKLPDTEDAIITDNQKVINTLNSLCIEMDARYELLKTAFVRNIKEYNAKIYQA